jgi:hypothetical protein
MGRVKDHFIELRNLEIEFLEFLGDLFRRMDYRVLSSNIADYPGRQPDLVLIPPFADEQVVVELKLHRSARVPLALLRNAFAQLDKFVAQSAADRGILVITQPLVESHYMKVERGNNDLWDLQRLADAVRPFNDLSKDFGYLVRAVQVGASATPGESSLIAELASQTQEMPPQGSGEQLARALEASKAGTEDGAATKFETICQEALELLFGTDFAGWNKQQKIEDGFHRVDVIARLVPVQDSFWATLASDFLTRYVVFEFKNYNSPISQDQIYTTEKYLFTKALRSVAIIVARNGESKSARRAMRGALREQGKLILCVSMAELCQQLRGWDVGEEPTSLLYERMDEMLMQIAR